MVVKLIVILMNISLVSRRVLDTYWPLFSLSSKFLYLISDHISIWLFDPFSLTLEVLYKFWTVFIMHNHLFELQEFSFHL